MKPWKWQLRPEVCPCQMCQQWREQQEVERVARVLANWGSGPKFLTRSTQLKVEVTSNDPQGTYQTHSG